jgi:hypothetical protein
VLPVAVLSVDVPPLDVPLTGAGREGARRGRFGDGGVLGQQPGDLLQ